MSWIRGTPGEYKTKLADPTDPLREIIKNVSSATSSDQGSLLYLLLPCFPFFVEHQHRGVISQRYHNK